MSGIRFEETAIPGLLIVRPDVSADPRGTFTKTFAAHVYEHAGLATTFAEEYYTQSTKDVVRGMHFQLPPHEHDKLVFCAEGSVTDVVVDLRRGSPMFRQAHSFNLEGPTSFGLYIPAGCAHGFCGRSSLSTMAYRVTSPYAPESDAGVLWSSIDVDWPVEDPVVSARDSLFAALHDFDSPFIYSGV